MTIKATHIRLPLGEATERGNASGISTLPTASAAPTRRFCSVLLPLLDRWRQFVFTGIACVYLLGFNGQWIIEPDSGLYLNLARNLALGRGYTYGGVRHETVYPGLPVALAGLYRLFPNHFIFAADLFIFFCAIATLALVYRLVLLAYNRPTAVAVVLGVALSHEFFRYSFEILSDMPFLMGVMAVLTGHEALFGSKNRKAQWWDWALLISGLVVATATRPTMIGLLAVWVASLVWLVMVRRNWIAGGAIVLCAAIVGIFLLCDPRRFGEHGVAGGYEQYAIFQLSHVHELAVTAAANIRDLLSITLAKAAFGMRLGPGWLDAICGLVAVVATIALLRKRLLWGLWAIVTLATLIMFVSNDRYLLAIVPLIVIGWWHLLLGIDRRFSPKLANTAFALLLLLGMGPNIVQVVGAILQQRSYPFLAIYQKGKYDPFARIAPDVARLTSPGDIIICPPKIARMMAFLTDRACYEENEPIPDHTKMFLILDPADIEYSRWLEISSIGTQGGVLARTARADNQPEIYLMQADR